MEKIGVNKTLKYSNIPTDQYGWIDASKYMPRDYDLCFLKIKGDKKISGWANGFKWDGHRLSEEDEVIGWRKLKEPREVLHAIG